MKISPIASQGAVPVNPQEGRSAGSDRLAKAKQIAAGMTVTERPDLNPPQDPNDHQLPPVERSIKRLKLNTNFSTNRHEALEDPVVDSTTTPQSSNTEAAVEPAKVDNLDQNEQAKEPEVTEPLSPQLAAIAKQKRALQLQAQALAEREKALEAKSQDMTSGMYSKDQIKANALSVLRDAGVTNDELTEAVLRESQDYGPGFNKLESEVRALKEELANQNKSLTEREALQEQQVLKQMTKDAEAIVAQGDDYELVREAGYVPKAIDLIHKVYKQTGEVMDLSEALNLIETELLNDSLKFAQLKKVQAKLTPQQVEQQSQGVTSNSQDKTMKTLTNRDGTSARVMSRRERAIAIAEGRLKP